MLGFIIGCVLVAAFIAVVFVVFKRRQREREEKLGAADGES